MVATPVYWCVHRLIRTENNEKVNNLLNIKRLLCFYHIEQQQDGKVVAGGKYQKNTEGPGVACYPVV
jgi:hypothetical protein